MPVDLRTEKTLGLVGSILTLLGGLSDGAIRTGSVVVFSNLVSLIGFIFVLMALHGISTKLNDERPFKYYLYSVIVVIGGLIVFAILLVAGIISAFATDEAGIIGGFASIGLGGFAVLIGLIILSVYYQIQAWRATYEITGVEEFNQVATFLKWGAITLIILVGVLLLLIAEVFQIIAFSRLPDEIEPKDQKPEYDTGGVVVY